MQKTVYNEYLWFHFLGFATSVNVLSTTRYLKAHHVRNTLTYIRNRRKLLKFTEDLVQ